ncbi:extensin-like [Sesamum indicum]|uniref:Extensin-like n=1 Tax=Sesamum indicum TaxID=4182 RepID=A0A6I9TYX5_SESIN|nr:extensin-like [Sesamum indicum]
MDFSVIRPKPPAKKPIDGPPPKPPSAAPPPGGVQTPQPPPGKAPPQNLGPYMEDLDHISGIQRMRSIEYTNARTWRMHLGDYPKDYYDHYGNYEHGHHPVGFHYYDHHHMPLPPRRQRALLPPDHRHSTLPGPPLRLGLPPPEYHCGPPPATYYYPPPQHGGLFSDENPNGCMIM